MCVRAPGLWLKARTVTKSISPLILQIRHFGKRCVAPIAPVKWHKPEAMLLRLGVRERAAVELETHSHSAAVSESQSTEHTPNNLMEMLCLLCRKGPAHSPIRGIGENHQNMCACESKLECV